MPHPPYGITREYPEMDFDTALGAVTDALATEGFGVLTEIDVQATLKTKLDVDYPRYRILGACNPPFAHQALTAEPLIGLLLPCNVVVAERAEGGSLVSMLDPARIFSLVGNDDAAPLAEDVRTRLERALDRI